MSGQKKAFKRKYYQKTSGVSKHNLLTFGRHDPKSLPSDDSDDSTYEPTAAETSDNFGKKRKRRGTSDSHNKQKRKKYSLPDISANTSPCWSANIPNELLHKVFWHAVSSFGAVPLLCRAAQVCQKWNLVASDPSLWKWLDLSFMASFSGARDETLNILCAKNLLSSHVRQLNFCGWQKLTSASLEVVATNCSGLTSLNLAKCKSVRARGLSFIADNCKNLTSINLSSLKTDATSNISVKNVLQNLGSQLNALYLAGNKSVGLPTLTAIQTLCGNLKILDLSDTSISNLNVERLQAGCPKIVELRLAQLSLLHSTPKRNELESSAGFPDLELLSLASITGGDGTDDMLLQRLLKTSTKLRQIDLRGCEKITHNGLLCLPIVSLEQLFLSRCKMSWKALFGEIGQKWKETLKDLDVSWGSNFNDDALMSLANNKTPNTVLSSLNIAGSGVTALGVRAILYGCSSLKELNLTSCRGVPRGLKQLHDERSIEKLREQLHAESEQIDLDQV